MGFEDNLASSSRQESPEQKIIRERNEALKRLEGTSFVTEKGSVYTYGDEGRTTRFKAKENAEYLPQDIAVFADLSEEKTGDLIDAMQSQNPDLKRKIYVVEMQTDGNLKIIRKATDVMMPQNIRLAIYKDGKMIESQRATLKPTEGYTVFDTRHFKEGDGWQTERHIGHKVIKINKKEQK